MPSEQELPPPSDPVPEPAPQTDPVQATNNAPQRQHSHLILLPQAKCRLVVKFGHLHALGMQCITDVTLLNLQ